MSRLTLLIIKIVFLIICHIILLTLTDAEKVVLRTSAETFAVLMHGQTHDIISLRLESLARTGDGTKDYSFCYSNFDLFCSGLHCFMCPIEPGSDERGTTIAC